MSVSIAALRSLRGNWQLELLVMVASLQEGRQCLLEMAVSDELFDPSPLKQLLSTVLEMALGYLFRQS